MLIWLVMKVSGSGLVVLLVLGALLGLCIWQGWLSFPALGLD